MKRLWPLFIGLLLLSACDHGPSPETDQPIPSNDPKIVNVTHPQASNLIHQNRENPNFVILDIRTPEEYQMGHLQDSQLINFYSPNFQRSLSQLDRNKQYLVYCRSGNRSGKAVQMMSRMGFQKVYNLQRGASWGLPQPPVGADPKLKAPGQMSLIGG